MRSTLSERLEKLKEIAMIESIGSSCRLAGNKLSNKEVEQLMSRIEKNLSKNTILVFPN